MIICSIEIIKWIGTIGGDRLDKTSIQNAFADGMHSEIIPPIAVNGRELGLFVRLQPTYIIEGERPDVSLDVRLFDYENNQTSAGVTYIIYIGKFDSKAQAGIRPLFVDMFYSNEGPLTLNFILTDGEKSVNGVKSQYSEAWVANGGIVDYKAPLVLGGGLYYIAVIITGINGPSAFFPPENAPRFEAGLSIGYYAEYNTGYSDNSENVTLISYYDKINDFRYDANSISWSMPFDWNLERLNSANNILIHQEIKIPKSTDMGQSLSFEGTVNGITLSKGNIALDPFSSEQYLTVHYILSKPDIMAISSDVEPESSQIRFTLLPAGNNQESPSRTVLSTEGSGIEIRVDWEPAALQAGDESKMRIQFFDELNGSAIDRDVIYDLSIRDMAGKDILLDNDLVARNGNDMHLVTFPSDDRYHIEVNVRGILVENGTAEQSLDSSRAGIARAAVVVPEFPYPILLGTGLAVLLAVSRLRKQWLYGSAS